MSQFAENNFFCFNLSIYFFEKIKKKTKLCTEALMMRKCVENIYPYASQIELNYNDFFLYVIVVHCSLLPKKKLYIKNNNRSLQSKWERNFTQIRSFILISMVSLLLFFFFLLLVLLLLLLLLFIIIIARQFRFRFAIHFFFSSSQKKWRKKNCLRKRSKTDFLFHFRLLSLWINITQKKNN